ncbi:MAG: hypothetical protein H6876_00520 [Hyphomicrobiaceae bacterium]|nr:hypothetical protein [Hyphomicrobiaceae bacterium]MCC0006600.1 hypothetical protein [Hyphomicrobiaceae bacterium]
MPSILMWGLAFTLSLVLMLVTAAAGKPMTHLAVAVLICLGIAFVGILENQKLRRAGAAKAEIAAATSRNMGFIYIWAATIIALTYMTLLSWHEWWHWFLGFALVGTACIFYSNTVSRDAAQGSVDDTLLSIGNKLTWLQLVGVIIAIVGMLIDGKLMRYLNPKLMDWAAQNTFFAGAVGLAILSAYALWASRNDSRGTAA